ncbi:MAG: 50S ribosomal protein L25 [Minisyncoccia bacterium]
MELKAQIRQQFKKEVKSLREQGFVPAELYGHNVSNMHLAVRLKDFNNVYKQAGESSIINLVIEDKNYPKPIPVLIYDIQKNYLNDDIVHIDFYQVKMDEKIKTHIPLEFIGESPAVKNYGGVLNKSMFEIEVEALPGDLPHSLQVDLNNLTELGQTIYVKDLIIPKGVKVLVGLETPIVTVITPEEETQISEPVDVSAVKVETEEKKLEREKENKEEEN